MTLLRLGEREKVLPVFEMTDDPEALTQFIFRCRDRDVKATELLELLALVTRSVSEGRIGSTPAPAGNESPADASGYYQAQARYSLLLALGEYALAEIPESRQASLLTPKGRIRQHAARASRSDTRAAV